MLDKWEFKGHVIEDSMKNIIGIPLSEKWLKDFGFTIEKDMKGFYAIGFYDTNGTMGQFEVMFTDKGYWIIMNMNHSGTRKKMNLGHFEYVHQLQNLYWCLCGEELEIK